MALPRWRCLPVIDRGRRPIILQVSGPGKGRGLQEECPGPSPGGACGPAADRYSPRVRWTTVAALAVAVAACDDDGPTTAEDLPDAGGTRACDPATPTACTAGNAAVVACNADGSLGDLVETCPNGPCVDGACTVDVPRWSAFVGARETYLRDLADPIEACVTRHDTTQPLFHGCDDWHSAVHGTWALLALTRLTGDPTYTAIVDELLEPSLLAAELDRLETTGIEYEIPYGYAWFLRLARERAAAGRDDLVPLAAEVAADLEAFLLARTPSQIEAGVQAPEYGNLSWAALNLYQYAVAAGDGARAQMALDFARRELLPWDAACPLEREATFTSQFFPPCLHRALALLAILPPEEAADWLAAFVPADLLLAPLTVPTTAHSAGLDFSRAWGLWSLYQATGDVAYLQLYLDHVETWIALPEFWAESYDEYAHWVPQFGVYAIARSFE